MAYYLRHTRVFGVPIQFAVVAAITTVVVVYLSGWAALSSSEARANLDKNACRVLGNGVVGARLASSRSTAKRITCIHADGSRIDVELSWLADGNLRTSIVNA